jgi:hypothetical protein
LFTGCAKIKKNNSGDKSLKWLAWKYKFFGVFLTVHVSITLVIDQINAQAPVL